MSGLAESSERWERMVSRVESKWGLEEDSNDTATFPAVEAATVSAAAPRPRLAAVRPVESAYPQMAGRQLHPYSTRVDTFADFQ
jgi:hypothetical protein